MSSTPNENRNDSAFLDFKSNPSLADALADVNVNDEFKCEVTFCLISKDSKGAACSIELCVPEGYEAEEPDTDDTAATAPNLSSAPGYLGPSTVVTAMKLKKKGQNG
jgi:hypothetical protein